MNRKIDSDLSYLYWLVLVKKMRILSCTEIAPNCYNIAVEGEMINESVRVNRNMGLVQQPRKIRRGPTIIRLRPFA